MYLFKIMFFNVTTFSYNTGTPGGALYLGNIGSPKDRCVSNTCDFFFLGSLLRHQFHFWKPLGGCSGSVSQRPEVKIFKNERLIRRFETRYVRNNPGSPFSSTTRQNWLKFDKHMHQLQSHTSNYYVSI